MNRAADPPDPPGNAEPLHPLLGADVATRRARAPFRALGVAEVRRIFRETQTGGVRGPEIASTENRMLPVASGALPVRIYRPSSVDSSPLIVYFHGGGFAIGDLDTHDRNVRGLAAATGAAVMSVDYRLAPEHPFPAAVDDALNAVRAAAMRSSELRIDSESLFVAGDSAGAVLALVAALSFKGGRGPKVAGIIAVYPATDFMAIGETGSFRAFGDGSYGLSIEDIEWFRELYIPNPADRADWRCSPALAADVRGLPPTLIVAATYDVLRDEAAAFAARLADAQVPVVFRLVPGVNHGFMGAPNPPPQVADTLTFIGSWFADMR